jgi:hypothetical protein
MQSANNMIESYDFLRIEQHVDVNKCHKLKKKTKNKKQKTKNKKQKTKTKPKQNKIHKLLPDPLLTDDPPNPMPWTTWAGMWEELMCVYPYNSW